MTQCVLLCGCHPPLIPIFSVTIATDSSKIKDYDPENICDLLPNL